ncbi:MAG: hypothetical protein GC204_07485 [Chloroflexi bacterium]|nr:hypothetical protein [Chloroflexota bacterium]
MDNPLMILPCLSAQLELYPDRVILRPVGTWAWVARMVEQSIPITTIENVRLLAINPNVSGVLEIKRRETVPKSIYVIYAHAHDREARAFCETLDDLMTRKDVLHVIRPIVTP